MKFPFLASVILFVVVLTRALRRQRRLTERTERDFWARETEANTTRRKSLDSLEYITIPMDELPTTLLPDNPAVAECLYLLRELSAKTIVNLTGYSNTDLKLEYGAPNIKLLMDYDQNYTLLARTLQQWADILLEEGYPEEACAIMEFAISTRTDISRTYFKLAEYWNSQGELFQMQHLIDTAKTLRSANKNHILRTLRDNYPLSTEL